MISNYAFSGWIANLGVVPLFSFAFFLFTPDFFLFIFLRILVCVVFEDIIFSLKMKVNVIYKELLLPRMALFVKIFLISFFHINITYGNYEDLFLANGEQIEIEAKNLKNFSIGNRDVLKHKFIENKGVLLIKGSKIGFSDLVIWKKDQTKKVYHLYVTSKKEQLKKMEIAQILKESELHVKTSGKLIYVEGEISSLKTYLTIKNLMLTSLKDIIYNIHLTNTVTKKIISKVYLDLYSQGASFVRCQEANTIISCEVSSDINLNTSLDYLQKHLHINFRPFQESKNVANFIIRFNIISIESNNSNTLKNDFDRIENDLNQILNKGPLSRSNNIFLQEKDYRIKQISTPELNIVFDKDFNIQLGGETPYKLLDKNSNQTLSWKFSGLKISGKLNLKNNNFFLSYKSVLTQGSTTNISGPKGESSIFLIPSKRTKLYAINFEKLEEENAKIPLLAKIPLIKELFRSHQDEFQTKKILVYAILEET